MKAFTILLLLLVAGAGVQEKHKPQGDAGAARSFQLEDLVARAKKSKRSYLSFLNEPTLSTGIYRLPKGGKDGQSPHGLDEVYYVIEGKATFVAAGRKTPAKKGAVLFVRAGVEHRFTEIEEDLVLLVFFSKKAPAKKKIKKAK